MSTNNAGSVTPIQDELPSLVRLLRKPAGDDPRFGSMELIRQNRTAFVETVHATWKDIHWRSLNAILSIEQFLTRERRRQLPSGFVRYLDRTELLWRRMNDALVWMLVGEQDHVIRTICHRKDRPRLSEANLASMLKFLEKVNADPLTVVIWSDATTCVDVGDIVCRSLSGGLNGFIEVKEGVMNQRICDLMAVEGPPEELAAQISVFAKENGPKSVKQLERVVRQSERREYYLEILKEDHGFDPRRGEKIAITESAIPVEHYDGELQKIIDRSNHDAVLQCVDQCLWVYADRGESTSAEQKVERFEAALTLASPASMHWFQSQFGGAEPFAPVVVEDNLTCPEAIPLYLRNLDPETVRDLLIGKLMRSVFLFLDWHLFGRMISEMGAELVWSTIKEGRRELAKPLAQRTSTFGQRIPRIQLADGRLVEGLSKVYRILFEGVKPSTIAAQYIELLNHFQKPQGSAEQPDPSHMA